MTPGSSRARRSRWMPPLRAAYAQEIFEGMKAYRLADGGTALFRPEANAARFRSSAQRMAMAELPEELFLGSIRQLVRIDHDWIPTSDGGCALSAPVHDRERGVPGGQAVVRISLRRNRLVGRRLFQGRRVGGHRSGCRRTIPARHPAAPAPPSAAAITPPAWSPQAEAIRRDATRCCSSDAAERRWIEELGGMNIFFVFDDGTHRPRRR